MERSSFLSKWKYKPSAIQSFVLEIKEPHVSKRPHDSIAGEVVMHLSKPLSSVSISLTLQGQITRKSLNNRNKVVHSFLSKTTPLYGQPPSSLTQGTHKFPFNLRLPSAKKLYNSIVFEKGAIDYHILCCIRDSNDNVIAKRRVFFNVVVPLDVSSFQNERNKTVVLQSNSSLAQPKKTEIDSSTSSSSFLTRISNDSSSSSSIPSSIIPQPDTNKKVTISVHIPHSGFVIGEKIPIAIFLSHYKEFYHPAGIIVTLVRICRVNELLKHNNEPMETYRKDITQTTHPLYVNIQTNLNVHLQIPPDAFATFDSLPKFFTFQYYIEVIVNLSTKNIIYTESNKILVHPEDFKTNLANKLFPLDTTEKINVEKLKRLRNVTGMSIETVIGTSRSITPSQTPSPDLNDFLSPQYQDNHSLVPQYTPNDSFQVPQDKQELEYLRLQNLESEPPDE